MFHSFDKVTSLFIHIMPCATLHCVVHLIDPELQRQNFPAIWTIKTSESGSPTAYANIISMIFWSTLPYAFWQLTYYFFITVRRREKIAAGRPTSFTWLRKSYSKTWIGKLVLSLPNALQEPAFMGIQYLYALLTILPCPLWFLSRWASSLFMIIVFSWSIYNGSTYYIDVFGKRFQKELEDMRAEVSKWQSASEGFQSPLLAPHPDGSNTSLAANIEGQNLEVGASANSTRKGDELAEKSTTGITEHIPLLDESTSSNATSVDTGARGVARER